MRKGIIATIVGMATLGLATSAHYIPRHFEQRKIDNIPQVVQQTKQTLAKVRDYFADGFITPEEASDLYRICRSVSDSRTLRDSQYLTTQEGARIGYELFEMRHDFQPEQNKVVVSDQNGRKYEISIAGKDVSGSDVGMRLDKLLADYASYLQTDEYRNLVHPLNPQERLGRHLVAFLND
jgi:hypothetical protein